MISLTPDMLALILYIIQGMPIGREKEGPYLILKSDFNYLAGFRDRSIPEADFMADFEKSLKKMYLAFVPNDEWFLVCSMDPCYSRCVTEEVLYPFILE